MAKTTNWTNGNAGRDWNAAGDWSNGVPVDTDTVQVLDGGVDLPNANLPNAGETFILVVDGKSAGAVAWNGKSVTDFCGSDDWNYSSLTVGASGRNDDTVSLDKDSAALGTITAYGTVYDDGVSTAIANALITVKDGGVLYAIATSWAIGQIITVETGGTLDIDAATLLANGGLSFSGKLDISAASSVLDVAAPGAGISPISCGGDCEIDWGSGNGDIIGGIDATGHTVTHTDSAAGNSITCDVTADFDLGGAFAGDVVVNGEGITVTAAAAQSMGSFTLTLGEYDDGGYDHTIAGDIVRDDGTLTSTGAWTMTADGDLKNAVWDHAIAELIVAEGATANLTGEAYAAKWNIAGSVTSTSGQLQVYNGAAGWWSQTGTVAAGIKAFKTRNAPGGEITLADTNLTVETNAVHSITMTSNIDLGTGDLYVRGTGAEPSPNQDQQSLDMDKYSLRCGAVTVGGASTGDGRLYLGSGSHEIASGAAGGASNVENIWAFETSSVYGLALDGDNIAVTAAGANLVNGTLTDCAVSGTLHLWGVADGGGNSGGIVRHGGCEAGNPLAAMLTFGGLAA